MNFKQSLIAFAITLAAAMQVEAQQPYGGCWHPDDIKNWSPQTDPDAKFNRSRVPLASRFKEPTLMKANANQHYEGQICNATILFNMCSLSPSQGAENFTGYQPTYWQYMDKLVNWAGSASEGIIIPPPAGSIDAAHAQGVKALGQVFFPPGSFGGTQEWVRQMLTKENGKYIYAIKLYEIAKYHGFDGWFINEETGGGSTNEWIDFIKEFNAAADAAGDTYMEIQWYNAARNPNSAILTSHKNTSQFLEYGSVGDKRGYAENLGCTVAETFSKIYPGVECVKSGLTGYNSALNSAFPTSGHVSSLALFCPEEHAWKDNVKDLLGTSNACGEKAYAAMSKTFQNEEQMWVNLAGDPSDITATNWRGISGAILERSVITTIPFVSDMNTGIGKHRFVNGEKKGTQDWNHSGMQSILPTWRWWIENRGNIKVTVDWDDAFSSGSSFKFTGIGAGKHLVRLYKTQIPMSGNAVAKIAYKGGTAPELKLSTASSVNPNITLTAKSTNDVNGWKIAEYDLSTLNGKTLYMVAFELDGAQGAEFSLGRVAVLPASYAPAATEIRNAFQISNLGEEFGDVRLTWDFDWSNDFDHFNIYTVDLSKKRTLVGQTRGEAFYIPRIYRNANDASVNIEIMSVMKDGVEKSATTLKADFPAPSAPKISFIPSRSYVKIGETLTITGRGTGLPKTWQWTLPEGLELTAGALTDKVITVKATKEGQMNVTLTATNDIGTATATANVVDVLSEDEYGSIHNVALKKTIVDYSGSTNSTEMPSKIIDGVTNPRGTSEKWCNVSPDNWVIIDCGGMYRFYEFKIYDCKSGPENAENIRDYTIELSNDMESWTTVVEEYNRDNDNIKDDFIVPTRGRYIRFSPKVAGILRVWEFEAYGKDDVKYTINAQPTELRINGGETQDITVSYQMNGDERCKDFSCTVKAGNSGVKIGNITEDKANSTFTVPVTANGAIGETKLTIRVNNGGVYKETTAIVVTDCPDQPNVLINRNAIVRHYKSDHSYEAQYDEFNVIGLTDGNLTEEALMEIEDPSTHKKDLWAIFTADDSWKLSKVKIYLPGENYGTNDNDKEGFVNNEIAIAVGNDLTSLTTVKTFSNLEKVSELEYVFPNAHTTKYIAVVCTLNPYFYPSLAEVEAYEQVAGVEPKGPAEMKGWQHDVIVEALPASEHATDGLDWSDDTYYFYAPSLKLEGALCDDSRLITTSKGTVFKVAPFDGKNALSLKYQNNPETLTFAEPKEADEIQFLTVSASGTSTIKVYATYADGEKSETWTFNPADWYAEQPDGDEAVYGIGRIASVYNSSDDTESDEFDSRLKFRLYEFSVKPQEGKVVKSLTFTSGNRNTVPTILAVSRTSESSGIQDIENNPTEATVIGIYTLQGIRVENPTAGFYIIQYSDGTAKKVIIR